MAGNRIGRINEEIRKELSALLRTVKDPRVSEGMLTITRVDTTSDLRYARVYISALNCADEKGLMKGLKSAAGYLRARAGPGHRPALHAGIAVFHGRLHRPRRAHSGPAEPREARQPRQRGHRAAGGPGMSARLTVQETADFLRTLDGVLILTHVRPDGDTVGCSAALCRALRALGRTAYLLENPEITETYTPYAEGLWAPKGFVPGAVVSVDIAALNLLPENAVPYKNDICLAIDHHGSQEFFAERTCLDAEAAACGEIVYEIVGRLTDITPEMALALYVAVSTDCGCFVYANTTARTHRIAAALMEQGIDVGPVNKALFRTKSPVRLAMEARMVADMELYDNGRVVVMSIPLALCRELGAAESDVEELSSLAALVQGTDCGITLRELKPGRVKLSLRTGPRVDASAVCRVLGGGGHKGAAGATVDGTLDEAKAAILAAYTEVMG